MTYMESPMLRVSLWIMLIGSICVLASVHTENDIGLFVFVLMSLVLVFSYEFERREFIHHTRNIDEWCGVV